MVLRTFIIILALFTALNSQASNQLFFTDSYETNLYKSDEAEIIFNNNLFKLLDSNNQIGLDSIFNAFFKEIKVDAQKKVSDINYQIAYSYNSDNKNYLTWSKLWHSTYESMLNNYLNNILYEQTKLINDTTAASIAYAKLLYFYKIKHSSSLNAFGRTRIHIQIPDVNIQSFINNNIPPNQTWNRVVTNSKLSSFNEAYYVDSSSMNYLFLGPNSKSRLSDCVSLHLLDLLNNHETKATYFSNYTFFLTQEKDSFSIDSTKIKEFIPEAFEHVENLINSPKYAFYNHEDLLSMKRVKESYTLDSFYEFINIFIRTNNFTALVSKNSCAPVYSYFLVKDTIQYKQNVEFLKSKNDSALLDQIASFLLNNSFREFQIFGNASRSEYIKIENSKYKNLVKKYNKYNPLKISKRVDLSLYRALVIFDYLYKQGVPPQKMFCLGKLHDNDFEETRNFAQTYFILKY